VRSRPLITGTSHGGGVCGLARWAKYASVTLAFAIGLAGSSIAQVMPAGSMDTPQTGAQPVANEPRDPLEGFNRKVFQVNLFLDDVVLRPSAKAYRWAVPKPGRRSVSNFLDNLDSPVILANDILQGEFRRASVTTARFGINSTIGIGGLFDPARGAFGLQHHSEDFGQTLAVYGVGGAPYLMAPLLGPTNPRDGIGTIVDQVFDPLTYFDEREVTYAKAGLFVINVVSQREAVMDTFDEIERTSIDFYAQTRSIYYQTRQHEIKNGKDEFNDLPDIPDPDAK
jgi:phospholipid-binding lipoprotein MlaA